MIVIFLNSVTLSLENQSSVWYNAEKGGVDDYTKTDRRMARA